MDKAREESIIGDKTQEIGEFDPDAGEVEADLQVDSNSSPLEAMTGSYKYAAGTVSILAVEKALQLFNAEHGRYPKDHDEFMEVIIKRNQIKLPVLPGKRRYQYDVENHELKIMEAK